MSKDTFSSPPTPPNDQPATQAPHRQNATLQSAKQRSGLSYQMMANRLGVSKWELYNYLVNDVEPGNPEARRRLNLGKKGEWVVTVKFIQRDDLGRFT